MAKVTFSNGTVVNFNGNPTPQDIQEVATKLNLQPPAPSANTASAPSSGGFWSGVGNVAKGIGNFATSMISKLPGQQIGQDIGTALGYAGTALGEKSGTLPKGSTAAYDLSAPSPEAAIGDTIKGASLIGGMALAPETITGAIGAGALTGAGMEGGQAMTQNASASQVAGSAVKGGIVGGVTAGLVSGVAELVGSIGQGIVFQNLKPTAADIKNGLPSTAEGLSDLLKEYGISGSLPTMLTQTQSNLSDLSTQLRTTLGSADTSVDLGDVFDQTKTDLTTGRDLLKGFGSNTKIAGALSQLEDEISQVGDTLSVPDAQIVKQAAGGVGSWQFGKFDPESTATESVYNKFYTNLKTAIEDASPDGVKEINSKIQDLIPVQNALLRRIPIAQRAAGLGLSDIIALTASSMNPGALPVEFANLASKSTWFGSLISGLGVTGANVAPTVGGITSSLTTSNPATAPKTQ